MKTQIEKRLGNSENVLEFRDIKITSKRQITIPKAFFDHLGIEGTVHAYLLNDGILLKPVQKKSIQEMDLETIVRNVINEGYTGDDLAEEIAHRVKNYNDALNRRIEEFLDDMSSDNIPDDQGDEFNGLDVFFDQENGETTKAN